MKLYRLLLACLASVLLCACGSSKQGSELDVVSASPALDASSTAGASSILAPQAEPTSTASSTVPSYAHAAFSADDFAILDGETACSVADNTAKLLSVLGKDYTKSEEDSAVSGGKDTVYTYEGAVLRATSQNVSYQLVLTAAGVQTSRNVQVGDSKDLVTQKYGNGFYMQKTDGVNHMVYSLSAEITEGYGNARIIFTLNAENLVSQIDILYLPAEIPAQ